VSRQATEPVNENLYALLAERFRSAADRPAVESDAGRALTYAELDRASARYARFLTELGIPRGARAAVQVEKSLESLLFYLGCLRAGVVYLPLNPAYRRTEVEHFLADARPVLVVGDPTSLDEMRAAGQAHGVTHFYTLDATGDGTLPAAAGGTTPEFTTTVATAETPAVILYTSGTTGRPKGAVITHRNLTANARALVQAWGWRTDDVLLHALPVYHIHGLFVACHCALLGASKLLLLAKFDAKRVVELLPRATVFMGVPTFYTRLLAEPSLDAGRCRRMRLFISGSAPLLVQTFEDFRQRTGHTILERYGMTETGMNTSNPLGAERRPGTVGQALPGVSLRIVDERERDVECGGIGQLLVRGDNVSPGYWGMPERRADDFTADGYFRTGDLARMDADGYVSIVGRAKDLIISGGLNVYPKEVESYIDRLEGVVESAVIGVPHADFGEAVIAVVVPAAGTQLTESAVIQRLKNDIAGFKVPKRVVFVDALPRNAMGKVQKNVLRERYGAAFAAAR